jgi:hypothetical protein
MQKAAVRWMYREIRVKSPFTPFEVEVVRSRKFHLCSYDNRPIERGLPYIIHRTAEYVTGRKYCLGHAMQLGLVEVHDPC